MRSLLTLAVMTLSLNSFAMETFKSTSGTTLTVYTESEFKTLDAGSKPMCLKRGGAVLEKNAAYTKLFGNNKKPCGASAAAKRYAGKNEVVIVKVTELPESMFQKYAR